MDGSPSPSQTRALRLLEYAHNSPGLYVVPPQDSEPRSARGGVWCVVTLWTTPNPPSPSTAPKQHTQALAISQNPRRYLFLCLALLVAAACAGAYAGAKIGGDGASGSCLSPASLFSSGRLPLSASVQTDLDSLREEVTSGALSGFSRDLVEQALSLTDIDSASAAVRFFS